MSGTACSSKKMPSFAYDFSSGCSPTQRESMHENHSICWIGSEK
jgi:hypothetical protein